ncbi:MAG: CPBP family intramembrane metalloprotease [Parvularculaceae bacterium]|nr:CPBP family intramembrane metalloprotease [Parvularculaceae bacterium]
MTNRSPWLVAIVTVLAFLAIDQANGPLYRMLAEGSTGTARFLIFVVVIYGSMILGPMLIAAALFGPRSVGGVLGLSHNPLSAFLFALLVTGLMPVYFITQSSPALPDDPAMTFLRGSVLPGFGEEFFFRAFLFGFLFRFARWGFLPAAFLVGAVFGVAHLYQGNSIGEAAGIFAITAFGGLWFAWLYAEWDFNIWVPTFFHLLMNAWWEVFTVSETAAGSMGANLVRLAIILLSVLLTIVIMKRRRGHLKVAGSAWLWGGPREVLPH